MPELIHIADGATRKDIDVCEGAIGWTSNDSEIKVLHLYESEVEKSGIQFSPSAQLGSVYYADPHREKEYINTDNYFSALHEEKLAELQHIAYSLGAKAYWVEVIFDTAESYDTMASTSAKLKIASQDSSFSSSSSSSAASKGVAGAKFSGTREPIMPTLVWYANDKNMQNLIKMRFSEDGAAITDYTIELSNSSSATMSLNTALKVNSAVIKLGVSCNFSRKGREENSQKMYFHIEF